MTETVTIDTRGFTQMCRGLSKISTAPIKKVILAEAGKVLERAIALTPALNVSKARLQYENAKFSAQPASLYTPKTSGGLKARANARLSKRGYLIYDLEHRYPDALWTAIVERRKASFLKKLAARGVSKASWLQIADMLGLAISAPGYVRKAQPASGPRTDGLGRKIDSQDKFYVELENRAGVLINKLQGASILRTAINGRRAFYEKNLSLGVFDSIAKTAKQYPGIFVKAA